MIFDFTIKIFQVYYKIFILLQRFLLTFPINCCFYMKFLANSCFILRFFGSTLNLVRILMSCFIGYLIRLYLILSMIIRCRYSSVIYEIEQGNIKIRLISDRRNILYAFIHLLVWTVMHHLVNFCVIFLFCVYSFCWTI
jgi:hypothetical protein